MTLKVGGVGTFPNAHSPRVVWLGVRGDMDALGEIAAKVEAACVRHDFPPEDRPFKPHLTLGRVKSPKGRDALAKALGMFADASLGEFTADAVSVMKSELRPSGAVYTEMKRIRLN